MECFAFGGATVRFASLETSFHAANHTIPPPPSTRAIHIAPRIKTARRFTANNNPQFILKISKLRFFNKVHNIVDHNLVNPTNTA